MYSKGKVLITQSCPNYCDPMECSPPGFSIHGIFQARILEQAAISFSRCFSQPRDRTHVSCTAGELLTIWAIREAHLTFLSQFSSVIQSCPTLCDHVNRSRPGLLVHHQLPEFTQTHVHWVGDAIQPSHPLLSPFPLAFNLSQHQGLFQWLGSSHKVAKVLEFQLQHQHFQWIFRTDFL